MRLVEALEVLIALINITQDIIKQVYLSIDIIKKAQAEGRDVTDEEWAMLDEAKNKAFKNLEDAIKRKEALKS